METITLRFPHLSEMIFDHLDCQSLANCNIVSNTWSIYIGEQKFYAIRIIKETVKEFHKLTKPWFEVFKKANTETIMELRSCVNQFYENERQCQCKCQHAKQLDFFTPLHISAAVGNILLYQSIHNLVKDKQPRTSSKNGYEPVIYAIQNGHVKMAEIIIEMITIKNPKTDDGLTALHAAANYGHVKVCETIMKHVEDKNPKSKGYGDSTPLHMAASYGHIRVCELIVKQIDDKNPRNKIGWTPLHYAAKFGCKKTYEMIMKTVQNKNPMSNTSLTPLHIVAILGELDICDLIIKNIKNKHPRTNSGNTPLHFAAEEGHIKVCIMILQNVKSKNPRNHDGKTPLTIARENNQFKVCWLLEKIYNCVQ